MRRHGASGSTGGGALSVRLTPEAFAKRPGGVRRTALDLSAALRAAGVDVSVLSPAEQGVTPTTPTPSARRRAALQASEAAFLAALRMRGGDGVVHSLYYDQALNASGWPLVVTVHDMIHERFGVGNRWLRWAKRLAVAQATLVVTPSRATAEDVRRGFAGLRTDVMTIPWGVSPVFLEDGEHGIQAPRSQFLLYVGARHGYKNFALLLGALRSSRELDELCLVLVGGEPLRGSALTEVAEAAGRPLDRVKHVRAPADLELRALYDEAAALVVTSRCEGFGLPLLEALARGCPVACARGGTSAEVTSGHALLFDVDSPQECATAIATAADLGPEARTAARAHARQHTWAATAAAYVEAYRTTLRRRHA